MIERSRVIIGALVFTAIAVLPAFAAAGFGAGVSTARPKWEDTVALVSAGGGPANFKTLTLVDVLAAPNANAEVAKLTKRFGAASVKQFITTFDFVIADVLRLVKTNRIALPASHAPDPKDGETLVRALYRDGIDSSSGRFNVDLMLDRLVSHPLREQVVKDIYTTYGVNADAAYHVIFLSLMTDLKVATAP